VLLLEPQQLVASLLPLLARSDPRLPWVKVEEEYRFETEDGRKTLAAELTDSDALAVWLPPDG
jgi:predicted dithiol-disulfide oxidoreductase (DUF899 family)